MRRSLRSSMRWNTLKSLLLPRVLDAVPDRPVMLCGATLMIAGLVMLAVWIWVAGLTVEGLLSARLLVGFGYSAVLTPSGRLLRRSSHEEDRPAVFAAQFALSHACWLITYPLSGWLMTTLGAVPTLATLAALAMLGVVAALILWPTADPLELEHTHSELPTDHPHIRDGRHHRHAYVIDDQHHHWPR